MSAPTAAAMSEGSSAEELRKAYEAFRSHGGVIDLSERTKLLFTGVDRVRFLHGQVTNNVRDLLPGHSRAACVTTAKGRLCAEVMISAFPESLLVDAEPSVRTSLRERFERYLVADEVTISDVTDQQRLLHFLSGDRGEFPDFSSDHLVVPARRWGREGRDLWLSTVLSEAESGFFQDREKIVETLVEILRIESGVPRWGFELDENTLPPEAHLEATHIDYHKGCYIGQEVISRLRSVGHVNRELVGFSAEPGARLAPGSAIFSAGDTNRELGKITSVAFSFALERAVALGYLKRGTQRHDLVSRERTAGQLASAIPAEVAVTVHALPFIS